MSKIQKISLERIYRLFELAEQFMQSNSVLSKRCIRLAREIGTRNNARFPRDLKNQFCKKCNAFLKKEKNANYSVQNTFLVIKCLECGFERKTKTEQ